MKLKLVTSALLNFRNIAVFLGALGISALMSDPAALPAMLQLPVENAGMVLYPASVLLYLVLAGQTLSSKEFHEKFNRKQKIRTIQDLNYSCLKLAGEAKRHTNNTYYQKLKKVMDDKNEIVNSFFRGEHSFLKERIVEQTLNLVVSYIRLLTNFCIRSRELSNLDVSEIVNRINLNSRKANFAKDVNAVDDIRKVIEMDQKILERLKEEKKELERISAKLDYMESTVNMFKHQILSSVESQDMLEKLETAVNEATALDNVLEDRRKSKLRM